MGSSFIIAPDTSTVSVGANGTARVDFRVRNGASLIKRARVKIVPLPPMPAAWLAIEGTTDRPLFPGASVTVTVLVTAPRDSAPGSYRFRLDVIDPDEPDEVWARGPMVTLEIELRPAAADASGSKHVPPSATGVGGSKGGPPAAPPMPGLPEPVTPPVVVRTTGGDLVCPVCGASNPADATFCWQCGSWIERLATPAQPASVPSAPLGGQQAGQADSTSIRGDVVTGRPKDPGALRRSASGSETVCPHCGHPNASERRFCGRCGMALEALEARTAPLEGMPPASGGILGGLVGAMRRLRGARPPTASDSATPAEIRIERHTSATFPAEVEAGATARLAFSIGEVLPGGVRGTVAVVAPAGVTSVDLVATVHAPAFEVVSPTPPPGGGAPVVALPLNVVDPSWAVHGEFVLRAKPAAEPADTTILLDFWHRASPVGQIRIETRVVPRGGAILQLGKRPSVGDFRVSGAAPPPADITLFITDEGGGRYVIQATTPNVFMRELGAFPAGQNAWSYSATMLERFRDASDLPEAARVDRVVGLGLDLWRNLPPAFHDFYWGELHGRDRSIAIYSQEPYIPWELIRPPGDDGRSPGFLGSDFRVARWRNGRLFPDPLAVRDFVVIAPHYRDEPLVATAVEAADLVSRFGARVVDGEYGPVAASLRSTEIQLVHFAGHGSYDENAPLQSWIRLSDQALLPTDVRTFRQGLERGPFVFLNACEVGEQGWVFTGIGGWADTFCDVGCAGFVGPYWAVDDQVARLAALRFYDGLAAGRTVGEAIRDVRRAFDEPGPFVHHPTWLAYSLHCQPNIRIDLTR